MSLRWENAAGQQVTTEELLRDFARLDPTDPTSADNYFMHYGPGHPTILSDPDLTVIQKTQERLTFYEHILHETSTADIAKYQQVHKGTIFYLIAWLAFTLKDYEKAFFYVDAALSEDIRKTTATVDPQSWERGPAAGFLLLDSGPSGSSGRSAITEIRKYFGGYIDSFNSRTGSALTLNLFTEKFVKNNISDAGYRSIISGFYVFITEYIGRLYLVRLRSIGGGSIQPFLVHLFSGCLVFESLLKKQYGIPCGSGTLGDYLGNTSARADLEIGQAPRYPSPLYLRDRPPGKYTLPSIVSLLPAWGSEDYKEKIIAVCYAIRNTAGHDLSWPDHFDEITYQNLCNSIIDAILWFIWKVKV